jgi:chromosomal replication initiator protein
MDKQQLWQNVLSQIQVKISQANFNTWFQNTQIIEKEKGNIIIGVPNSFSKEWLEKKYHRLILNIFQDLNERIKNLEYKIVPVQNQQPILKIRPSSSINQLELEELNFNKQTNLNPKYTFDNFIVGPFNEIAHATATAITKNPGHSYNPFFVYGGVGLGKTHLLQAVGNKINQEFGKKKIRYFSSERFITGVIDAIKNQNIAEFKEEYRKFDVLIIDDIQFMAGKEKTQEEFFHLFNILYEDNKQIIISSDRPPRAISALEERLRSRFEGGVIADIGTPDFESRSAILKQKVQERKTLLDELVLEYIASNIQKNVRELEGALNSLMAWQNAHSQNVNLEIAKNLLKRTVQPQGQRTTFQKVVKIVAEFYGLREKDLFLNSRKKEIVKPRQIAMYLLRIELNSSYPFIGKKFGGKDHTTAIYACNKVSQEIERSEQIAEEIEVIKEKIYAY